MAYSELIDTLWNVNYKYLLFCRTISPELIDTLWNVNVFRSRRVARPIKN